MEFWDIYDINKRPTGRTMKRNDWCLKDGEYHLTVLGVVARPDGTFLITKRVMTKAWAPGWWEVSGGAAQAGESSYLQKRESRGGRQLFRRCLPLCDGCERRRSTSSGRRDRRPHVCHPESDQGICSPGKIPAL